MRRKFLNLSTVLSALLCAATAVMWVRSYTSRDALERFVLQKYESAEWNIDDAVYSAGGLILWVHHRHPEVYGPPESEDVRWHWYNPLPPEQDPEPGQNDLAGIQKLSQQSRLGISTNLSPEWRALREQWRAEGFYLLIPHRVFVISFSILPSAALLLRFRKRDRLRGLVCPSCSYNLIGNTSGTCPECGTTVAEKAET